MFKHLAEQGYASNGTFDQLLEDLGDKLAREYGGLVQSGYAAARVSDHPVIEHFFRCSDAQVIDFILMGFQSWHYRGKQRGVDELNRILRESAIGYEFTPYVEREVQKLDKSFMGKGKVRTFLEYDYPEIIVKHEEYTHDQIVKPCLAALANPIFKIANEEMLKAHEHIRKGNFNDAMTCCGAAYESVIKTILDQKKWKYNPTKDTCATLVDICVQEGLLQGFYADAFKAPGRIRNNLSSAHGRGPAPAHIADPDHAQHMIQLSSANIVLLVKLAKL
jgi:hypothetical protein